MVLAGGVSSRKLNLDAFVRQASEYEDWEPGWDKLARMRIGARADPRVPGPRVSGADDAGSTRASTTASWAASS